MNRSDIDSIRDKFWSNVDLFFGITDEDCWNWTGAMATKGYGRVWGGGKTLIATHVAWMFRYGVAPTKWMLHKCDNPSCVNPSHLFEGGGYENSRDCLNKGRHVTQRKTRTTHQTTKSPFSTRLKAWRDSHNMSLAVAAKTLGVTFGRYCNWEQSRNQPNSYAIAIFEEKLKDGP